VAGEAVGLVELGMIANDLAAGRLARLFDIGVTPGGDYAYHLVCPQGAAGDPGVGAFREWVLFEMREAPAAADGGAG